MKDILAFSKNPKKITERNEWRNIYFLQFIILMILIGGIANIFPFIITKIFGIYDEINNLTLAEKLIRGVLIAPIAEELIFRLILKENKKYYYISIAVATAYLIVAVILGHQISSILMGIVITLESLIFIIHYYKQTDVYSKDNYKYLYWGNILVFGLMHGNNFSFVSHWQIFLIPLLTLPQIFLGWVLSYIRVKYGIRYSIGFHFLINLQVLLIP